MPAQYDKRNPRPDAEALVARRIDASRLRYRKADFGLADGDRLRDHVELVTIRVERLPNVGVTPYHLLQWGVKVNGKPAGYVSSNYHGDRFKFLPYWWEGDGSVREVPDAQDPAGPAAAEPATGPQWPSFAYRRAPDAGAHAYEVHVPAGPAETYQGIGIVQRFGSLPSCQHWQGLGGWPGAAWTRSCAVRDAAAREVWRQYRERQAN